MLGSPTTFKKILGQVVGLGGWLMFLGIIFIMENCRRFKMGVLTPVSEFSVCIFSMDRLTKYDSNGIYLDKLNASICVQFYLVLLVFLKDLLY